MAAPSPPDVIIAGAGMAGASLALALAHGGLKPLLIDPQPFEAQLEPTYDGRASAIALSTSPRFRTVRARRFPFGWSFGASSSRARRGSTSGVSAS